MQLVYYTACLGFMQQMYSYAMVHAAGLLYRLFGLHAAGYYSAGYGSSSWLLCNFLGFKSPVIMQLDYYTACLLSHWVRVQEANIQLSYGSCSKDMVFI